MSRVWRVGDVALWSTADTDAAPGFRPAWRRVKPALPGIQVAESTGKMPVPHWWPGFDRQDAGATLAERRAAPEQIRFTEVSLFACNEESPLANAEYAMSLVRAAFLNHEDGQ